VAAGDFFQLAKKCPEVARAFYEYSTLMDGFVLVQECRRFMEVEDFEAALSAVTSAGEIFRATLHFAFLSPYVAACAGLEGLESLDFCDPQRFQSCKNSIALLEQAKIVLSFQDERHPLLKVIEAHTKLGISMALETEYQQDKKSDKYSPLPNEDPESKRVRSQITRQEFLQMMQESGYDGARITYFPMKDYDRAENGALLLTYPSSDTLSVLNVGKSAAFVQRLGKLKIDSELLPKTELKVQLKDLEGSKIRISYKDASTNRSFDEGCLSLI
jgi:hypothetical protein